MGLASVHAPSPTARGPQAARAFFDHQGTGTDRWSGEHVVGSWLLLSVVSFRQGCARPYESEPAAEGQVTCLRNWQPLSPWHRLNHSPDLDEGAHPVRKLRSWPLYFPAFFTFAHRAFCAAIFALVALIIQLGPRESQEHPASHTPQRLSALGDAPPGRIIR